MPNVWTHNLFGYEIVTELGHDVILRDRQLKNIFQLGCQGPDPLFYHHFFPWQKDKPMYPIGSQIHRTACGPFLMDLLDEVKGRGLYNPAVIYTLGFILHHILDRHLHPYIFYHSGFKIKDHLRFEIILDSLLVQKKLQIETWKTPVWKELYIGDTLPLGIAPALMKVTSNHFPKNIAHISEQHWHDSYRDMIKALRIFHDPYGVKRVLLAGSISTYVYKKRIPKLDFLNESHREWNCPTNQNDLHTSSVWDLWEIAKEDGLQVLREVISYIKSVNTLQEDVNREKVKKVIGNKSYETGKDCDLQLKITYVQSMM